MGEDGVGWAFNLLLFLSEHSYGDIDDWFKMCGYGGHVGPYRAMDEAIMGLIERRVLKGDIGMKSENDEKDDVVKVRHQWTDADAAVGVFKTGRPNKQQRGQIASQKMQWMKERSQEMRDRREKERDWVGNALVELVEQRDFITGYGHDGFFVRSIARLKELRDSSSVVETAA